MVLHLRTKIQERQRVYLMRVVNYSNVSRSVEEIFKRGGSNSREYLV